MARRVNRSVTIDTEDVGQSLVDSTKTRDIAKSPAGSVTTRRHRIWSRFLDILPTLCIVAGLLLLSWPVALDLMSTARLSSVSTGMASAQDGYESEPELSDAEAYNALLGGYDLPDGWNPEDTSDYDYQMDVDAAMAYVDIPAINVTMPIYHGVGEASLMQGVGHLEGTSLPIGGHSANCVISAHSGMPEERAFDDIRMLTNGDLVIIHALGQTLAYKVSDIAVISQNDYESWRRLIAIEPGCDVLTLVTCTPYGVNDHRLIITCDRTPYVADDADTGLMTTVTHMNMRYVALLTALAVILVYALVLLVTGIRKSVRRNKRRKARLAREQTVKEAHDTDGRES